MSSEVTLRNKWSKLFLVSPHLLLKTQYNTVGSINLDRN